MATVKNAVKLVSESLFSVLLCIYREMELLDQMGINSVFNFLRSYHSVSHIGRT